MGGEEDGTVSAEEMRATATEAAELLRGLLERIEAGEIDATPARIWHLRGALDALEALLAGRPIHPAP
jgi:hypothetical protein